MQLQIVCCAPDGSLFRPMKPTFDENLAETYALECLKKYNVDEVFICTVHSAYRKTTNIEKII